MKKKNSRCLLAADSRRSDALLHDQSRSPSAAANRPSPRSSPRARHAKVHRRRRSRRVPVQPHPRVKQHQQPDGHSWGGGGFPHPGTAVGSAEQQRTGQGRTVGDSAIWFWRRWTGRKPEQDGVDDGGFGYGGWGVRSQRQEKRVLPIKEMEGHGVSCMPGYMGTLRTALGIMALETGLI